MACEKKPEILRGDNNPRDLNSGDFDLKLPSFEFVLDTACERLRDKYIQYSIRRIRELNEELMVFEKELDEFIGQRHV